MKHHIKDGDRLIATIETHGEAIVVVHEPQKEIKPVQFADDKFTFTQSTPEQRKEIIRIAKRYERPIFHTTEGDADKYPYAGWDRSNRCLCATSRTPVDHPEYLWLPFDEFVARLKGEWVDDVERIIPFDVERWRKGEFVRVQTRDGREVEQLKEYDCILTPLVGIIKSHAGVSCWGYNGKYANLSEEHSHDLMLVVKGEGGKP
jgi:hypothetical protein